MYKPKDTQERIIHRLKIAKGHLERVISMVEEQTYCIEVIHQSEAVQKALEEVDNLMLENHLNTCVLDDVRNGRQEKAVSEIMKIFEKRR